MLSAKILVSKYGSSFLILNPGVSDQKYLNLVQSSFTVFIEFFLVQN